MNFLSLLGGGFTKTVSNLVDNLHTSEEEKLEAKLEMLKLNSEHQYRMEKIQADRDIAQVELAKGQLEINKEETKSSSIFIAGWRPAIGWIGVFAMAYQFVLYPFLVWGTELVIAVWGTELFGSRLSIEELERVIPPKLDWQLLWPIIAGMLGIGGMRSFDKLKHTDTKKISKK